LKYVDILTERPFEILKYYKRYCDEAIQVDNNDEIANFRNAVVSERIIRAWYD